MNQRAIRKAFTLIELLTVMAIITLLIGILTPALGAARDRARATAVRAQLNAMEVGLEAFTSDEDGFPPSNANLMASDINNPGAGTDVGNIVDWEVTDGAALLQGAHLLVDALVGRDFLGYDPKAPGAGAPSTYNRWDSTNDRRKPYIPADGVDVTSVNEPPEDAFGTVPDTPVPNKAQPTIDNLICRVFRDKFGWPILYYRANPTATQNTPIIQTGTNPGSANYGDGVYDGVDNEVFTSHTCTAPAPAVPLPTEHRVCDANIAMTVQVNYGPTLDNRSRFAEFIRSFRASTFDTTNPNDIIKPRPVRSDRFILWSAGKDGIYGNLDDVANFQVLSTER
ncbi:MAG: prepilin-type N-terminal cleavage/methylation domain-containing protein [Planctomycetia bacterium]|jgi:prepilin-type N-terminal cleavage/methylation domain-containing protein|nr:prepilin-type N-terminal cleavage/methylation domain-containing protein [Planctomycetia bacterium]MCC7315758.1 prepilin-type N-terminal cleavage/methylation domain-containing protein [Planctomycetota bacterium]